jgi:secretion/DNA translocation related TadE-like protein
MVSDRESGSATPIVVAVLAVIVIVGLAAVDGGAVIVASAKNESAADLAALAAAHVDRDARAENASSGSALHAGCEVAREVASQNGVAVTSCRRGPHASVDVAVELLVRAWPLPLHASARAGPAWG